MRLEHGSKRCPNQETVLLHIYQPEIFLLVQPYQSNVHDVNREGIQFAITVKLQLDIKNYLHTLHTLHIC